jgi:hypothetical protein
MRALFQEPPPAALRWSDIEMLLLALGCEKSEGRGSRLRFTLGERTLFVHRPHPRPEAKRYAARATREFLEQSGIEP